jgi:hypothetical protein
MNRNFLNLLVECIALIAFSLMAASGMVLQWILVPGAGRIEMLGQGRRHQNIDVFLGYSRHEWGEFHWWCGLIFLVLMVVHVGLHWRWIVAVAWGSSARPQPLSRRIGVIVSLAIVVIPIAIAAFGRPRTMAAEEFRHERAMDVRSESTP